MWKRVVLTPLAVVCVSSTAMAFDLPKEVTPDIRRACEKDVRRLCITKSSTMASVKSCVRRNFSKLNIACKLKLASLGL